MVQAAQKAKNLEMKENLVCFTQTDINLIHLIAYDLWSPLSAIQVCLEILQNESNISLKSRQKLLYTGIQNIKFLQDLVQNCIDLSQLNSEDSCEIFSFSNNALAKTLEKILPLYQVRNFNYLVKQQDLSWEKNESTLEYICKNDIAIISHELRTPLCTIQICLESLINSSQISNSHKEYEQEMLEIASNDLERLKQLVKDFFMLARLQNGQLYQHQEFVEFSAVIELAIIAFQNLRSGQKLPKISLELPVDLPKIKTDSDKLLEVIIKILDNSYKFTPSEGEIKIQVQHLKQDKEKLANLSIVKDNQFLEVIISDTGRGISPNNLKKVFNCFYQEENALQRTTNGSRKVRSNLF